MKLNYPRCRRLTRLGVLCELLLILFGASRITALAPPDGPDGPETRYVTVYVNAVPYPGRAVLYEDTTYVELHEFAAEARLCEASWDEASRTAVFRGEALTLTAADGAAYIEANGRALWCPTGVFAGEAGVFVPLRAAAKAFGGEVAWNADEFAAYVTIGASPIADAGSFYEEGELYWLSRIIYAEAGIEPFEGQIAVGNVVLNRMRAPEFPDTIYDVIFDHSYGVAQFSPTENGTIYCEPDEEAVTAAKLCLEGYTVSGEILYFINARLARSLWVPQNCTYVMTIAGHDFYS